MTARSRSDGSACGLTAGGTPPRRWVAWIRYGWPARCPCWPNCATARRDVRGWRAIGAVELLAQGCAEASLLKSVTAADQLIGLGPGLTPSGDDVLSGLLVALRHLGTATRVSRAVWLADWLAAAVTFDARGRTTPISATLLHCAARGEASGEMLAVLRGLAGRQSLEPALHRLLQLGHTSGPDLACGLRIGLASVIDLEAGAIRARRPRHQAGETSIWRPGAYNRGARHRTRETSL